MIYIYSPRKSDGARHLVTELKRLGMDVARLVSMGQAFKPDDLLVNWGAGAVAWPAITVLNKRRPANKYKELQVLSKNNIPCVNASLTRQPGWLARRYHHHEANDLRANLATGDYYVEYRDTEAEFRVHVWKGLSIRFGVKIPRIPHPHPKWRSWSCGWRLAYTLDAGGEDRAAIRKLAARAVQALGLDFGAVDIGSASKGKFFVFEVNTAPGIEGGTLVAYANKIAGEIR